MAFHGSVLSDGKKKRAMRRRKNKSALPSAFLFDVSTCADFKAKVPVYSAASHAR